MVREQVFMKQRSINICMGVIAGKISDEWSDHSVTGNGERDGGESRKNRSFGIW